VVHGKNRKPSPEEVPFFRPARSISGTRRRVTTDELEKFKKEHLPGWTPGAQDLGEASIDISKDEPPPRARASSRPSMPPLDSPWVSLAPSMPPPPSLWVPAVESVPPPSPGVDKIAMPPAARAKGISKDSLRAGMLSGIAGFVDAAGFLALFGLLPAHMTGDIVWAGAAVADSAALGWFIRIAMLLLFVGSVAIAAVAARIVRRRGQSPLPALLAFMTLSLAVFWAAGAYLGPLMNGPDGTATLFISGAAVFAMGIQNAIMREALGTLCPTTVMTGNVTQVTMDLVELAFAAFDSPVRRPARRRKEALARIARFGLPVASFTVGALAGAFTTNAFGFEALVIPTLGSLLLTVHSFRVAHS